MRDDVAPGRPREFDETEMLRKIMRLFWRGGYEGVSLSEIMTETGLKKGSLYAAYGDKRAMYLKALAQYEDDVVASAAKFLMDQEIPALERISAFLSAPLNGPEQGDRSGCFLCNASADQADLNDDAQAQVSRGFERLRQGLRVSLQQLRPDLSDAKINAKAQTLLSLYIGLRILVRSGADVSQLRESVELGCRLVEVEAS